jgi:hypothetical protein
MGSAQFSGGHDEDGDVLEDSRKVRAGATMALPPLPPALDASIEMLKE